MKEKASVDDSCSSWAEGGRLTVADVTLILDVAKTRPQVFTQTIKVMDPLRQTAEQCLESFSTCLSSTYTGVMELGASQAQLDVVLEAWRVHRTLERKADGNGL